MATGRPNGRPPKPVEIKRREGNPGKRPLPDAPVPGEGIVAVADVRIPDPPYPLDPIGQFWYEQTWKAGASWLSPDADLQIVYDIAKNREEIAFYQKGLQEYEDTHDGSRYYYTKAGQMVIHPYVTQIRALEAQRTGWLAALGFSPADRARLGLAEVRVMDELDQLEERKRARERHASQSDLDTDILDAEIITD